MSDIATPKPDPSIPSTSPAQTDVRPSNRDESKVLRSIRKACKDIRFARNATYWFMRDGKEIEGPTVELARELARLWCRNWSGYQILSIDREWVRLKGFFHDTEIDVRKEFEDQFRRPMHYAMGSADENDRFLKEQIAKRGAICERTAILQGLPQRIVREALTAAAKTIQDHAKRCLENDQKATVADLVTEFAEFSVTPGMLARWLGHELEQITFTELAKLRKIQSSIREGNCTPDEFFTFDRPSPPQPQAPAVPKTEALVSNLRSSKKGSKPIPAN